tara:strand:- start:145 stop:528 length:384 start_codon:yes stop_codon:yes gene_type:complete
MKDTLRNELIRYNYQFEEEEDNITIDLGAWQEVKITIKDDKIMIKDKLRGWNILTTFPMSIKTALFLNPIFVLIIVSIIGKYEDFNHFIGMLIALNILIVTFSINYLIKLEGIKTKIAIWLNDSKRS